MHDERGLRPVPPAARRSGDRRGEEIVFSCFNQDQKLDEMDWDNLAARLRQNTVSEKLTNLWLERLFAWRIRGWFERT